MNLVFFYHHQDEDYVAYMVGLANVTNVIVEILRGVAHLYNFRQEYRELMKQSPEQKSSYWIERMKNKQSESPLVSISTSYNIWKKYSTLILFCNF